MNVKKEVELSTVSKGLYRVVSRENEMATIVLADESHPVFKAHFEGNPILPGFLHIDITAQVFEVDITSIKSAKYFEIVRPSEQITIRLVKENVYELSRDGVLLSKLEIKSGL